MEDPTQNNQIQNSDDDLVVATYESVDESEWMTEEDEEPAGEPEKKDSDSDDDPEKKEDSDEDEEEDDEEDELSQKLQDAYDESAEGKVRFEQAVQKKHDEIYDLVTRKAGEPEADYQERRAKASKVLEDVLDAGKKKLANAIAQQFSIHGKTVETAKELIAQLKGESEKENSDYMSASRLIVQTTENFVRAKLETLEGRPLYKDFRKTDAYNKFVEAVQEKVKAGDTSSKAFKEAWKTAVTKETIAKENPDVLAKARASVPATAKTVTQTTAVNLITRDEWVQLNEKSPEKAMEYYKKAKGAFKK